MAAPGGIDNVTATITFDGGTGRFVNASGTAALRGQVLNQGLADPSWPGKWQFEGTITS